MIQVSPDPGRHKVRIDSRYRQTCFSQGNSLLIVIQLQAYACKVEIIGCQPGRVTAQESSLGLQSFDPQRISPGKISGPEQRNSHIDQPVGIPSVSKTKLLPVGDRTRKTIRSLYVKI